MVQIVISGESFFSYASVAQANAYLIPDPNYSTWNALTTDNRGIYLVQATRLLDSLTYIAAADTQDERDNIEDFKNATILIASYVAAGNSSILGNSVSGQEAKRYKAGSVELENFRNFSSFFPSTFSNWPQNILAIIRPYLKSIIGVGGAASFGTDGEYPIETFRISRY